MSRNFTGLALSAALALTSLGVSTAAEAAILNIDSKAIGVTFDFAPGTYLIQWIGVAEGGLYNGWNPSCPTGDCTSGWRDVFAVTTDGGLNPDFTSYSIPGPAFSSALAALAAFKAAPIINGTDFEWNGSSYGVAGTFTESQPWYVTIDGPATIGFFIPDGTKADNYGGVSLRITNAVPEPATWAMMILGLGAAGAMLRRQRRVAGHIVA